MNKAAIAEEPVTPDGCLVAGSKLTEKVNQAAFSMYLRSLYLRQFRSCREAYFEFDPKVNLICGPNAVGKTTLLEAIHCLILGRSFRSRSCRELVQVESDAFYLEAFFHKQGIDQRLRFYLEGKTRHLIHNDAPLSTLSELIGLVQGVIITPDDINLIKGPPAIRRQFLDIQLSQTNPLYLQHLSRYLKAMRHRNQLLKEHNLAGMESWEREMAHSAGYLVKQRQIGMEALQSHAQDFYSHLTEGKERLILEYRSHAPHCQTEEEVRDVFFHQLQLNRGRELVAGCTLNGPHKEDIRLGIEGRDVRYYASEGQQRSCASALQVGAWQRLKQVSQESPLVLIDDLGVSLDSRRRKKFIECLGSLGQLFLTTTEPSILGAFALSGKTFSLPLSGAGR